LFTEEEKDETEELKLSSLLKVLGAIAIGVISFFVVFFIFLILSDRPYAVQIFTLICYTSLTFIFIFFRTKLGKGYSLSNPFIQKQLPRLLAIHGAFSLAIFSVQTYVMHVWSRLPASWTAETGPKHNSWLSSGLGVILVIVWITEVLVCRGILRRIYNSAKSNDSVIN
jgi:uncharacterized membrane protein YidH (DUF202 family)